MSKRRGFLAETRRIDAHIGRARALIQKHGRISGGFLVRKGIPINTAHTILEYLRQSGEHLPIAEARGKRSEKIKRRAASLLAKQENNLLASMVAEGMLGKVISVEELAEKHKSSAAEIEREILELRKNPAVSGNSDLRELVEMILIKTNILRNPNLSNEQLASLIGVQKRVVDERVLKLKGVDYATIRLRKPAKFQQTEKGAGIEQFVRHYITGGCTWEKLFHEAFKLGISRRLLRYRVYKMKQKMAVEAEKLLVRGILFNPEDESRIEWTLERFAHMRHLKGKSRKVLRVLLQKRINEVKKEVGMT